MTDLSVLCLPGDVHVTQVVDALGRHFLSPHDSLTLLYPLDNGHTETWSTNLSDQNISTFSRSLSSSDPSFPPKSDTVWFRRFTRNNQFPLIETLETRSNIETEISTQMLGIMAVHFRNSLQVNPLKNEANATLKPLQLSIAKSVGLKIPETLISNDPMEVKSFFARHNRVIFKPLTGVTWTSDSGNTSGYTITTVIEDISVFDDSDFVFGPGIYQPALEKDFEVRVFAVGRTIIGMAFSPETENPEVDWRLYKGNQLNVKKIIIPDSIQEKIFKYMNEMGLVSAMLDFIVKDKIWRFLEANSGGQFLFMEMQCPEIPILDAFCKFLKSGDPKFRYSESGAQKVKYDPDLPIPDIADNHIGQFGLWDYRRVSLKGLTN